MTIDARDDEVARLLAEATEWAVQQPWALAPNDIRAAGHYAPRLTRRGSRPTQRLRLVGLVALVLAAVVLTIALQAGGSPMSAAAMRRTIAAAQTRSAHAATIRYVETVTTLDPGVQVPPKQRYTYLDVPSLGVSEMQYDTSSISGRILHVTEIDRRGEGFVRATSFSTVTSAAPNAPVDKPGWYRFPLGVIAHPAHGLAGAPPGLGADVGPIRDLGAKMVDGKDATEYAGSISVNALIRQAKSRALQVVYRSSYLDRGITSFPVRAWVGADGRLLRLWTVMQPKTTPGGPVPPRVVASLRYTYSNTVAHVQVPPLSDTTPFPNQAEARREAVFNPVVVRA